MLIYKILLPPEWAAFEAAGFFAGSPFDRESGYVHCSSRDQVAGVALRLFDREPELVVVALDPELVGAPVRWEPASPDGERFPHVYGVLPARAVAAVHRIAGASSVDATLPPD
jgi:uncharacterized protein (DUF952 family)